MILDGAIMVPDPALVAMLSAEGLPSEDVFDPGRVFVQFADDAGMTVGIGGYEPLGDVVLLRSIVVVPSRRGEGLGGRIVDALMQRARRDGAREAYALTSGPRTFLSDLGFEQIDRSTAPIAVRATRQASGLCGASAVLWRREFAR